MQREIQQLQIIVAGLMTGLLFFSAIATMLGPLNKGNEPMERLLLGIPFMGLGCAFVYAAQRRALLQEIQNRRAELRDAASVPPAYRRFIVAGGGLIEGPGFFAAMIFLLTGHPLAIAAAGLSLLLLGLHFPTVAKWDRLVENASLA
jgi:hypothetical protein